MITAKEMQERSLKVRYAKYGGKEGFAEFMRKIAKKGGLKKKKKVIHSS